MKRLLLTLAAAASAAAMAVGDVALADPGHDRGRDRGSERSNGGGWSRGDRGAERGGDRGGDRAPPGDRGAERGEWQRGRGDPRRGWSEAPPPESYVPYAPQGRGYGVRRGGYMPPQYRGEPLQDYGRYRLRPPPRGYTWMRVGGSYVLMSVGTGQIFDVVPY
jgi:Ni/Co efflux regulator RcnB